MQSRTMKNTGRSDKNIIIYKITLLTPPKLSDLAVSILLHTSQLWNKHHKHKIKDGNKTHIQGGISFRDIGDCMSPSQ